MIIAYLRVSTDKQDAENQRFELERFAKINNITIDGWVNETVSGTKKVEKRKLGQALTEMKKEIFCFVLKYLELVEAYTMSWEYCIPAWITK